MTILESARRNKPVRFAAALAVALAAATPALAASRVLITKSDCRALVRHEPAPDVAYKPGVDVQGRPVKPADLGGGSSVKVPEDITVDIGVDLERSFGVGTGDFTSQTEIAKVTVKGDRVYFNGVLVEERERHAIAEACRRKLEK